MSERKGHKQTEETKRKIGETTRKFYIPKENLFNLYINQKLSSIEIGKKLNISKPVILYWMRQYDIKRRNLSEARKGKFIGNNHPNWTRIKKICLNCKNTFYVPKCFDKRKFCSMDCWRKVAEFSEESKLKMSKSQLEILKDPQKKKEYLHRILDNIHIRPNKVETLLLKLLTQHFPNEWVYSGDYTVEIERKSPDFFNIHPQKKKIIEVFGDYWHRGENPQDKINFYNKWDFDCLVIWESELTNMEEIIKKIEAFQHENQ